MFRSLIELFLAHQHSREPWTPRQILLGRDRRIFERVAVNEPCTMDNQHFGLQTSGTAVNLSLGGVGILAAVQWPEGSRVRVYLEGLDLRVDGMIVFRKDAAPASRYGVKFEGLGMRSLWRLRRALRKHHQGPLSIQ